MTRTSTPVIPAPRATSTAASPPSPDSYVRASSVRATDSPEAAVAKTLLQLHKHKFSRMYSSSGFASAEALRKALAESPALAACYQRLLDEQVDFAMWQPRSRRERFVEDGFLNQFSTKSSQGMKSRDRRNNVESNHLWTDRGAYADLDPKVKPKYAYLRAAGSDHNPAPFGSDNKPDIYIFKKAALKDRVTFTPGDSLDRGRSMAGNMTPGSWDNLFVPWEHRELLAPLVFPSFREAGDYNMLHMRSAYFPADAGGVNRSFRPPPELPSFKMQNPDPQQPYVELQLWGDLSLDDVEAFEFRGSPPRGEFLEELLRRGIKIIDRRKGAAVPWTPPAGGAPEPPAHPEPDA